ncbi:MAG: hypothetical protein H6878_12335 [Rhodobiaceae bacterium]|nr:hypothetical protein [Rhodobiaceae bacterium]MCC0040872.1 hypothetical protein [Rhodobiaceae bacterium]
MATTTFDGLGVAGHTEAKRSLMKRLADRLIAAREAAACAVIAQMDPNLARELNIPEQTRAGWLHPSRRP